jgi:hypothetical protein
MPHESLGSVIRVLGLVLLIVLLVVKMSLPRTHVSPGDDLQQPAAVPSQVAPAGPQAAETAPDSDEPCHADEQCETVSWQCWCLPAQ